MKLIITVENDGKDTVTVDLNGCREVIKIKESVSDYARFFDEGCPGWTKDAGMNKMFLGHQETFANEKLKSLGYLFLNDVYDMLGMPRTKAGQVVGWVYDEKNPVGDNCVDFGIYSERNKDFVNGYERSALLEFNVDGNILDYIEKGS